MRMAQTVQVYVEAGQRRVFAGAVEWPGWCRSARDEDGALEILAQSADRYRAVVAATGLMFEPPDDTAAFTVVERAEGDATTDFGAPGRVMQIDHADVDSAESERLLGLLQASWATFDAAAGAHEGAELRKGPRGGGREVAAIVDHVLGSDAGYLATFGGRWKREDGAPVPQEMARLRAAVAEIWMLRAAGHEPPRMPRAGAGALWPLRYFARRSAWHALDHAWEIEDRAVP